MKFTWGTAIAIVLVVFALGMGYAVYQAVQQDYDLVTEDYYAEELVYQEKIDQKTAALALEGELVLSWTEAGMLLQFPEELKGKVAGMDLEMYCVTEADNDFNITQKSWSVADITIPAAKFKSGKWIAKLTLVTNGTAYYFDPAIALP